MQQPPRGGASVARADALAQIALGLSQDRSDPTRPYRDVRISVGAVNDAAFQSALSFGTGSPDLAFAVARGELDVAAINPSAFLTMAYRGTGPFQEPLPLRALAVMPSWDRMAFAVAEKTGIESIADIRDRKYPLKASVRGSLAHATRFLIDEVFGAFGFSLRDVESWGGRFQYVDTPSAQDRLDGIRCCPWTGPRWIGSTHWVGRWARCRPINSRAPRACTRASAAGRSSPAPICQTTPPTASPGRSMPPGAKSHSTASTRSLWKRSAGIPIRPRSTYRFIAAQSAITPSAERCPSAIIVG